MNIMSNNNPIVNELDELNRRNTELVNLVNSRRTGLTSVRPNNVAVPEVNLNNNDIITIRQELFSYGQIIQNIASVLNARYGNRLRDPLQDLVDSQTASLDLILSIEQNQLPPFDHGMIIQAIGGLQQAILNMRRHVITLDSHLQTHSSSGHTNTTIKWGRVIALIITIISGVGGASYYFSYTAQNAGDINIDDSNQIIANSGFGSIVLNNNTFTFQEQVFPISESGLVYRNETLGFEIARPNLK